MLSFTLQSLCLQGGRSVYPLSRKVVGSQSCCGHLVWEKSCLCWNPVAFPQLSILWPTDCIYWAVLADRMRLEADRINKNTMEQTHLLSQATNPCIVWNCKFYDHICKSPWVCTVPYCFCILYFNVLPSSPGLPSSLFPSDFLAKYLPEVISWGVQPMPLICLPQNAKFCILLAFQCWY